MLFLILPERAASQCIRALKSPSFAPMFHLFDTWPNTWAASPRDKRCARFRHFSKIDEPEP